MTAINLAYYRKEDWDKLLELIDDKASMHDTWNEWSMDFAKTKNKLQLEGFIVKEVVVDLEELHDYCLSKGIRIDGKARSQFFSRLK